MAGIVSSILFWVLAEPAIYLFSLLWGDGLQAVWVVVAMVYAALGIIFPMGFVVFDWRSYSKEVFEREQGAIQKHEDIRMGAHVTVETTPMLGV